MHAGTRPDLLGRSAAVLTVGTELVLGIGLDTNSMAIASALTASGMTVRAILTVPDDQEALSAHIASLCVDHSVVVVTGGLGPTQDDITREAAATALGLTLREDRAMRERLESLGSVHHEDEARTQLFSQAQVLEGATVLPPTSGTAPGQIVPTDRGLLALLPGPPHEMSPMLARLLELLPTDGDFRLTRLSCIGITESDAQVIASRALAGRSGVRLTVLAGNGVVSVILHARGLPDHDFDQACRDVRAGLGVACFSDSGKTLAEAVVDRAIGAGVTIGTAESCTGGLVAAGLTAVPGASGCFRGGIVAYHNDIKESVLGVSPETLAQYGAVSSETAAEMASGARIALGATLTVSVTGIAGPGGGSDAKPVGTVCLATATADRVDSLVRTFRGDRGTVQARAASSALALLLRAMDT